MGRGMKTGTDLMWGKIKIEVFFDQPWNPELPPPPERPRCETTDSESNPRPSGLRDDTPTNQATLGKARLRLAPPLCIRMWVFPSGQRSKLGSREGPFDMTRSKVPRGLADPQPGTLALGASSLRGGRAATGCGPGQSQADPARPLPPCDVGQPLAAPCPQLPTHPSGSRGWKHGGRTLDPGTSEDPKPGTRCCTVQPESVMREVAARTGPTLHREGPGRQQEFSVRVPM
ncbi:uncharacterized protein LOC123809638 [Phyllostomus hastatus]|uniref:uncharacterized protein LOC123809638 n=1 Tax=Phyllostomus hastatus TaxID=9423 RepID=UPI001E680D43|nr:uncharacterized protein LOC123809638 [Phyllostomus hastatus]